MRYITLHDKSFVKQIRKSLQYLNKSPFTFSDSYMITPYTCLFIQPNNGKYAIKKRTPEKGQELQILDLSAPQSLPFPSLLFLSAV